MKIVWWIDNLGLGGAQNWLKLITKGLAEDGHEQTIICLSGRVDKRLILQSSHKNVQFQTIGRFRLLSGLGLLDLWCGLKRESYDVSVTTLLISDILGMVMSRLAGISKRISVQQSSNRNYSRLKCVLLRFSLQLADYVILNSVAYRESVSRRYLPYNAKVDVISNAIETGIKMTHSSSLRKQLGLEDDWVVLGMVSRLAIEKGQDIAIEALSILNRENVHLVMTGEEEYRKVLIRQAEKFGLSPRIHFLGYVEDVNVLYHQIDVLLQPSTFEGMPTTVLEAMEARCPVIATAVDGTKDIIRDDYNGWLIPPNNPLSLSQAIDQVLNQSNDVDRRVRNAAAMIQEHYDIKSAVLRWIDLINDTSETRHALP